jgi:DNA-directed RNA polymerase subunit K/omega
VGQLRYIVFSTRKISWDSVHTNKGKQMAKLYITKKTRAAAVQPNMDLALEQFEHNQFNLVLCAAVRAREIAATREHENRDATIDTQREYKHGVTVQALMDAGNKEFGLEYLNKVK